MITGKDFNAVSVFNLSGNIIAGLISSDSDNHTIILKPGFYIVELTMRDGKKKQEKVIVF